MKQLMILLLLPLGLVACGQTEAPAAASLAGVVAASDVCESPVEGESDEHEDNPLFRPMVQSPIKALAPLLANVRARDTVSLNGEPD